MNGCETSTVVFLEGIYVRHDASKRGVASLLLRAVEDWARSLGCLELASDAELENRGSHLFHKAMKFQETERVIFFRKTLGGR
uniref:GNAT family N-acetyltransferase n=1 Tax=Gluconacetobacter tumulisoli TaxID=1286189 RepID=UPI003084574F